MTGRFFTFFRGTIFDFSRRQNTLFWVSQIAVVASTIIGVYLAASEGLKSAVEFHTVTTLEKKYYTLNALRQEVRSNNELMLDLSERNLVKDDAGNITAHRSMLVPELNWFVWTTMSRSTESLDLPVGILRDVNRYYIELTQLIDGYRQGSGRDRLINARKLYELAQAAENELIASMTAQLERYQARMAPYNALGVY